MTICNIFLGDYFNKFKFEESYYNNIRIGEQQYSDGLWKEEKYVESGENAEGWIIENLDMIGLESEKYTIWVTFEKHINMSLVILEKLIRNSKKVKVVFVSPENMLRGNAVKFNNHYKVILQEKAKSNCFDIYMISKPEMLKIIKFSNNFEQLIAEEICGMVKKINFFENAENVLDFNNNIIDPEQERRSVIKTFIKNEKKYFPIDYITKKDVYVKINENEVDFNNIKNDGKNVHMYVFSGEGKNLEFETISTFRLQVDENLLK